MSTNGEEEETGPSVDSVDPEERVAARRTRITRRLETQRRWVSDVNKPGWQLGQIQLSDIN